MSTGLSQKERPVVHVEPGGKYTGIVIAFTRGLSISGTVVDRDGGPVRGACVSAKRHETTRAYSDASGAFAMYGFSENEEATLFADAGDMVSELQGPFTVPAGGLKDVRIELGTKRTASISGVVVDGHNAPQRVYVSAHIKDNALGFSDVRPSTRSDVKGQFTLAALPAGEYEIRLDSGAGGVISRGIAVATIALKDDEAKRGVRLVLDLDKTLYVSGHIRDDAGKPVRSARVSVQSPGDHLLRDASSGDDGAFTVMELPPGTCTIMVQHPDYAYETVSGIDPPKKDIDIVLKDKPSVEGRVVDAKTDKPVQEFQVALVRVLRDGRLAESTVFKKISDAAGEFRLNAEPSPNYVVLVKAVGYFDAQVEAGSLEVGQDHTDVIVPMEQGSGRIDGRVMTTSGEAIANALVFVNKFPMLDEERERVVASRSDDQGLFSIESVPKEGAIVYAWKDGYAMRSSTVVPSQPSKEISIALAQAGGVRGRVLVDGNPVAGALVSLAGLPTGYEGLVIRTTDDGHFAFDGLPPGALTIRVLVNPGDPAAIRHEALVPVEEGETVFHEIAVNSSAPQP